MPNMTPIVSPLLAWALGNAWMLLWSLTALAPVLLHLWSRRQRHETPWAAMRFLRIAMEQNSRRLRLQQLLLLVLRILPLLLLGLALAEPRAAWLSSAGGDVSVGRRHWVFVLDASYSMQAGGQPSMSTFEAAKAKARTLVEAARPGDGFTLVTMNDAPEVLMATPMVDKQDFLAGLLRVPCGNGGATLAGTASLIAKHLRQLDQTDRGWQHEVLWLSDLARVTWEKANTTGAEPLAQLADLATLQVAALAAESPKGAEDFNSSPRRSEPQNLAVVDLLVREALPMVDAVINVDATIQAFGEAPADADATFFLDGQQFATRKLRVPAGGSQQVSAPVTIRDPGEHLLAVTISPDILTVDNTRYYVVKVRDQLSALCIEGRSGEARPIALALRPTADAPIRVETAPETALVEKELGSYQCVVVTNVGRIGADDARQLVRYVRAGGGLVVWLGDQVQPDSWNANLYDVSAETRLLPSRLGAPITRRQGLDPLKYQHPIVEAFEGFEKAGFRSTPVSRYFLLSPDKSAIRIFAGENGDLLAVEHRLGNGSCVLIATAASPQSTFSGQQGKEPWSEFAQWPSFLPLMQQTFLHLTSDHAEARNTLVGRPISGYFDRSESLAALSTPSGERHRLVVEGDRWVFLNTQKMGVYRISRPNSRSEDAESEQLRAVNVDTAESDLERFPLESLPPSLRRGTDAAIASGARNSQAFRWVLAVALLLLLAECWYSRRLSARRS